MEVEKLNELELKIKNPNAEKAAVANSPKVVQCKSKKSTPDGGGYGTGRRKDSVARVWVKPGKGQITINNRDFTNYFTRESDRIQILRVFSETKTVGQFNVVCTTKGGGTTGQTGAIIHGIARALDCISEDYHTILSQGGFLTRDSRTVERKKYGRRKARKKAQFSKR